MEVEGKKDEHYDEGIQVAEADANLLGPRVQPLPDRGDGDIVLKPGVEKGVGSRKILFPDHEDTRTIGIGGGRAESTPEWDQVREGVPAELFPYGLPAPPRAYSFLGFGWGHGAGCSVGPFLGIGAGFGFPTGVIFGAGAGLGAVCGAGFGGGFLVGSGAAYVPFGFNQSFFYSPKFIRLERWMETWKIQGRSLRRQRRRRAWEVWPQPVQNLVRRLLEGMNLPLPPALSTNKPDDSDEEQRRRRLLSRLHQLEQQKRQIEEELGHNERDGSLPRGQ